MANTVLARPDPEVLAGRVRGMLAAGRTGAARPLLAALKRLGAPGALATELEARLLLREGRPAEVLALLDPVLAAAPDAALHKLRAGARTLLDDHSGACRDAAEALLLQPGDTDAKAMLGAALLTLGHLPDAAACLADALRDQPDNPGIRLSLAQAQESASPDIALATLEDGIARLPNRADLRNAAMLLHLRQQGAERAALAGVAAVRAGAADACTFGMLGHAQSVLGRHAEAADAYAEALKLAPEDPYVRHLVAASGRVAAAERAPAEYVRTVFDGYAGRFEQHLIGLGYRVPGLLARALEAHGAAGAVLDLGCGTGLMAVACMDLPVGPWTGVDLSPAMLAEAGQKELYEDLIEGDLLAVLAGETRSFPVVLAGDVLCYFGDLHAPLAATAARMTPGGLFALSVERLDGDTTGQALGGQGRWAHSEAHVRAAAAAAGLEVRTLVPEVLRWEGDAPVNGLLAVLARPA